MSERRHRSSGDGRGRRMLVWAGWGSIVLLLGGNLFVGLVNRKGDSSPGFLAPEHLLTVAFWAPVAATIVISLLGLWWASKAYAHSERSSMLWARRGYLFTIVGCTFFAMATFDRELFPRPRLAIVAATVLGGQAIFSAMIAMKEYRRAASGEGSRRPRGRLETPMMTDVPVAPPDAPGTAK